MVARIGGAEGWASIAVSQSIGLFCGVVTSLGVNVAGSAHVVLAKTHIEKRQVYTLNFWARLPVFVVVTILGSYISTRISTPAYQLDAALMCVAMTIAGLSMGWYGIGIGSARMLVIYEAAPRAILMLISVPIMLSTDKIFVYPLAIILGTVLGLGLFHLKLYGSLLPPFPGVRLSMRAFKDRTKHTAIDIAGSAYASAPLPFVAQYGTISETASFASSSQLYRYGLFAIVATSNTLQSWVLAREGTQKHSKHLVAIVIHSVIGSVGFIALLLCGIPLTKILFGQDLQGTTNILTWFAVAYVAISLSTPLVRNILIPSGRAAIVLVAVNVSAILGLLGMFVLGPLYGPSGIAVSYAASEVIGLMILVYPAHSALKQNRKIASP